MNKGQQAFPCPVAISPAGDERIAYPGMTLRDYFAAKAMQGILAGWRDGDPCIAGEVADIAYNVANAMLTEREAR